MQWLLALLRFGRLSLRFTLGTYFLRWLFRSNGELHVIRCRGALSSRWRRSIVGEVALNLNFVREEILLPYTKNI
jgi:hypothetical protein